MARRLLKIAPDSFALGDNFTTALHLNFKEHQTAGFLDYPAFDGNFDSDSGGLDKKHVELNGRMISLGIELARGQTH